MFKLYRKIRYRKGYGVHSPFVYNLITKVIEEKTSYYAFEEIEHFRRQLLSGTGEISRITAGETQSARYGAFLFRLVHFFKSRKVIQIGSSTGILGLYLAMASRNHCHCYLLEERSGLGQAVGAFALAHNLSKLQYIEGDYRKSLEAFYTSPSEVDLLVINQLPKTMAVDELMHLCEPLIHKKSIFVLNGIKKDKAMRKVWQFLTAHPQSRVTMDLYALGLVFFDDKLPKRHYKTYFNDGKKQNLHANGRRRIYFFSRRKTGFQNPRAH
jgi:predicted O-methyltransferase YrrM